MRISELSRESGVPLSAVKYYQREGLLPEGVRTAPNQVDYGAHHVHRVRLIRAMLETGGLSIAATKDVLHALDADDVPLAETFAVAQKAIGTARSVEHAPTEQSRERIISLARARGWSFIDDNPGIAAAARALDGLRSVEFDAPDEYVDAYAAAAEMAALADVRALTSRSDEDSVAELMIVGTVLGDPLFAGLRRIAQEDATHDLFPVQSGTSSNSVAPAKQNRDRS